MAHVKFRWCLAAAALAAAALAGCHNNNEGANANPVQPPAGSTLVWSTFVKQVYSYAPDSTPINLDGLMFTFDVDEDPTAFDGLLM